LRLKRFTVAVAVTALSGAGLILAGTAPAFASTLLTCTGGSGTSTFSPGITNTPTQQTISSTSTITGCSGSGTTITGGTVTVSNLKTLATGTPPMQATCGGLVKPSPKGTLITTAGTATTTWSDGTTSTGSIKLKSTGAIGTVTAIIKITGGTFFAAGHTTKSKGVVSFSIPTGQTCPTLTMVNTTDATTTITQV